MKKNEHTKEKITTLFYAKKGNSIKIFLLAPRSILCAAKKKNEHTKTNCFPFEAFFVSLHGFFKAALTGKIFLLALFFKGHKKKGKELLSFLLYAQLGLLCPLKKRANKEIFPVRAA